MYSGLNMWNCYCGQSFQDGLDRATHSLTCEHYQLRIKNAKLRDDVERLENALRSATTLTRFVIANRGCTCNVAGHRCGTNLMLADVAKIEEHLS